MLVQSAEESYQKGMHSMDEGRVREAMAFFEAAIELERKFGAAKPQARYLSQYGLCLGTIMKRSREGVQFCREAAAIEIYNPDIQCNLGRVLIAAGRRRDAHQAFIRGLRMQSNHQAIISELKRLGVRSRPAIPFLSRDNPLNICLGRMRARKKD